MDQSIEFMEDLDRRFRVASGLEDRRYYSIFYSRVQPSRVMVIGIKPGGRTDGSHQLASQTFYEDWSHEYVDMNYRIAAVMRPALMQALGAKSEDDLRSVPKTNTFFQRAVGTDDFTSAELAKNAAMCAPFLAELIAYVQPQAIILEGAGARDNLVRHQCSAVEEFPHETVFGMRRGTESRFFRRERATLHPVGHTVELLTLGHPSHFGHLPEWKLAVTALQRNLGPSYLVPPPAGFVPPQKKTTAATSSPATRVREGPRGASSPDNRRFVAADRPPASFRYSPIHDFWQELIKLGPSSVDEFFEHLSGVGWSRPSGKPLTAAVVRTDLVSMVKHGFADVVDR